MAQKLGDLKMNTETDVNSQHVAIIWGRLDWRSAEFDDINNMAYGCADAAIAVYKFECITLRL